MSKKYQDKSKINSTCDKDYIRRKEVFTSFFLDSKYVPMTLKHISKFFNVKKETGLGAVTQENDGSAVRILAHKALRAAPQATKA